MKLKRAKRDGGNVDCGDSGGGDGGDGGDGDGDGGGDDVKLKKARESGPFVTLYGKALESLLMMG